MVSPAFFEIAERSFALVAYLVSSIFAMYVLGRETSLAHVRTVGLQQQSFERKAENKTKD